MLPRRRNDNQSAMMGISTVRRRREALYSQTDCEFVEPRTFCELLTSRRNLERANDSSSNTFGLLDRETGVRFLIEVERLFPTGELQPAGH